MHDRLSDERLIVERMRRAFEEATRQAGEERARRKPPRLYPPEDLPADAPRHENESVEEFWARQSASHLPGCDD
jgi:hypothetical protein